MSDAPVLWTLDARGVATVTLNRPKVNNAYNGDMIQGLHDAMDTLGKEARLRVVGAQGEWQAFSGRRGSRMDQCGARRHAGGQPRGVAGDGDSGRSAQPAAGPRSGTCAGRMLRRRDRRHLGVRHCHRRRQRAVLDHRGPLGPAREHHLSAAQRCDRRAPGAPLCALRRAVRRRRGAAHRPRPRGGAAARSSRRAARRWSRQMLENSSEAMGKTKQHILEHAWGGFDAPTLDALIQSHSDQRARPRRRRRAGVVRRKAACRMGAKGIACRSSPSGQARGGRRRRIGSLRDAANVSERGILQCTPFIARSRQHP